MSRFFSLFIVLSLFFIPSSGSQFRDDLLVCYLKTAQAKAFAEQELSTISITDSAGSEVFRDTLIATCHNLENCFADLKQVADTEDNLNIAENLENQMSRGCGIMEMLNEKFAVCFQMVKSDFLELRNSSRFTNDEGDCALSTTELYQIRRAVQKKCGVVAYRHLKEHEEYLKQMPCVPGAIERFENIAEAF